MKHVKLFEAFINEAKFTNYSNNELMGYIRELSKQRDDAASKGQTTLLNSLHKDIEKAQKELDKRSKKLKGLSRTDESTINEGKVTKSDFDKVVKVLSKSKYPFTVMLVTKWNEIDIVIGYDAPDDISDDIGQRLSKAKLNWGGSSGISISGDSSNYSRREYDEIARINGGHRDY